ETHTHAGFAYFRGSKILSVPSPDPITIMGLCDDFPTTIIACPFWLLIALTLSPTAAYILNSLRRHHRQSHAFCSKCSYDVRAHKAGDKCPECGSPIEPTA